MKKIIKGKKYDTETATKVGEWCNTPDTRQFGYVCETLYRKRNGEYFLHGEGGAASKYSRDYGDNRWGFGEVIIPLTFEAAMEWAEANLEADEYEAEFGEVPGDDSTDVVFARVPLKMAAKLERAARESGKSKSEVLTEILEAWDKQ